MTKMHGVNNVTFTLYSADSATLNGCPVCSGLLYPAKIYAAYSATVCMKHRNE
jgi:hypothetical protein